MTPFPMQVKEEHFAIVGQALLATLAECLGDKWNPPLSDAWVTVRPRNRGGSVCPEAGPSVPRRARPTRGGPRLPSQTRGSISALPLSCGARRFGEPGCWFADCRFKFVNVQIESFSPLRVRET